MGHLTLALQLSISGSIMALPVLLLRPVIWEKLPSASMSVLWTTVLGFFLIPINFSSPISIRNIANITDTQQKILTYVADGLVASADQSVLEKNGSQLCISVIVTSIWFVGMVILGGYYGYKYIQLSRSFKGAVPLNSDKYRKYLGDFRRRVIIYKSDCIETAFTFGIIKPKIVLSGKLLEADEKTIRHVLLHEAQHICHFDSLWGMVWLSLLCIHWFNPIAWLCWIFSRKDRELFCDIDTVKKMNIPERADYARTILNLTPVRESSCVASSFGSISVKSRISKIMSYQSSTVLSWVGLAALFCLLLAVFAPKALDSPLKTSFISFASPSTNQIVTDYTDATGEYLLYKVSNSITDAKTNSRYRLVGSYDTKRSALNTLDLSAVHFIKNGFGFNYGALLKTFSFECIKFSHENTEYMLINQSSFLTSQIGLTKQSAIFALEEYEWS